MNKALFTSNSCEWATPLQVFRELDQEFHFNLDPCATPDNAKCKRFYTKEIDGLLQNWGGCSVFCNPPYGREIGKWVRKCYEESKRATVVMLIPARTDTAWFHDYIWNKSEVRFIRGRLHFNGAKNAAPFPSMIVVFNRQI